MKQIFRVAAITLAIALSVSSAQAVTPRSGSSCSKAGITSIHLDKKFTCIKSGKKLVWDKGVTVQPPIQKVPTTPSPVRIALTEGCHAGPQLNAVLQQFTGGAWVDYASALGWDIAPSCATQAVHYRPWTNAILSIGMQLRWHISAPGAWDWYSSSYVYQAPFRPTGATASCKLLDKSTRGDVAIGWPKLPTTLNSVGTDRIALLFVDFAETPGLKTIDSLYSQLALSTEIFKTVSYGRLDFQLEPLKVWLRMPHPFAYYHMTRDDPLARTTEYLQDAVNAAQGLYNFKGINSVVVIANPETPMAFGPGHIGVHISAGGEEINFAVTGGQDEWSMNGWWLVHESGHLMSLVDLYGFADAPAGFDASLGSWGHQFVGYFSVMGDSYPEAHAHEHLAWERWLLGWLDDSQIDCVTSGADTVQLTPIESAGGVKAAVIPLSATTGIVLESRHALGYDKALTREGVLVYTIDTSINSGEGPIIVQGGRAGDQSKESALLKAGESLGVNGYKITIKGQSAAGETVSIAKV